MTHTSAQLGKLFIASQTISNLFPKAFVKTLRCIHGWEIYTIGSSNSFACQIIYAFKCYYLSRHLNWVWLWHYFKFHRPCSVAYHYRFLHRELATTTHHENLLLYFNSALCVVRSATSVLCTWYNRNIIPEIKLLKDKERNKHLCYKTFLFLYFISFQLNLRLSSN